MRKIIHGKVYDTSTARLVAEGENDVGKGDVHWYREQLYQKKTGEYFVWGEGGPGSPYAEHRYGGWYGDEGINPVSYEEARQWAEDNLPAAEYEAEFGTPEEGTYLIQCEVPQAAKVEIDRRRAEMGKTIAQIIAEAIEATK